jgi:probable phosphoglycerate mutase
VSAERVVLLRHGRTAWNAAGIWQGQLDVPLDGVGAGEAAAAAAVLAGIPPSRIVASDLARASATAGAVGHRCGVAVETDPALRELDAGAWQGRSAAEIAELWPDDHAAWRHGREVRLGGGESRAEAGERVADAVARHVASTTGGVLLVVGHGGSMRSGILRLLDVPEGDGSWLGRLRNAHWAVLAPAPRGWALEGWNVGVHGPVDCGHPASAATAPPRSAGTADQPAE